ncbi:hypothetical protein NKH19_32920 [Mesorhizobium sp. M1338]|uniref:hypothetical protein n=1 Tax=Mesorhizobium sp. M1338 TaxID=2957085 RepID=UPI003334D4D8
MATASATTPCATTRRCAAILKEALWDQVKGLLEDPRRVADEYRRRLRQARDETREPDEIVRLERQMATLRRGIGR